MKKVSFLSSSALRSASVIGAALFVVSPAFAQSTEAVGPSEAEVESGSQATDGEEILVTGSRIRRPNLESGVPVTSISGERFIQQGNTNVGDALNELPQLRSTFSQQNPGLGIGIAGLNLLDLRGLGTVRTLVLVNGRRHVAADILDSAASVDINSIPNDLIERVDIVTGAQSSVYGSDAIAGVVNFILRRDFDGLQVRGNAAVSEEGFGGEQYVSAMYGKNFSEGRGNITVHGEYANQERVFGSDIPKLRRVDGLVVVDVDPAGLPNGSDGIPDRVYLRDVRSATIHRYGLVPITQQAGGPAPCGVSTSLTSAPFNCNYLFGPDGRLIPQTGTRVGTTINGSFLGGNGQTGREETLLSVLPALRRYTFNLAGHYEFSDAAEVFVEAKWGRVDARGNNAAPSFTQGASFSPDPRERIRLDNGFLNPADRATIAAGLLASDCDNTITGAACSANPTSATRLSPEERAAIADGSYRFVLGKQFLDFGIRDAKFRRDTYRIVAGLRGDFNDDWNYEISANYGKFEEDTTNYGYLDRQRLLLALDAGINPATGQVQCRSQFDPAAAFAFQSPALSAEQNAFIRSRLAADIAACVPYNPFGDGRGNAAAAQYIVYNARDHAELEQFVVSGFVSGDTSQAFELPGGPVRFVVGGEYRREEALYENDPFVVAGGTNNVVIGNFDPDPFEVKEAYAELQLPILSGNRFFEELTLSGAGRVSDYNGSVGTVFTYNGGIEWAPVRDLRLRANYGRSVRAPNLAETGFPIVPNFAPNFQDPCSGANIGTGSATRAANCAADLGPLLANLATLGAPSLPILSGSNPNLKEEKSDSFTIGAVVQPSALRGFSLSVDYFDIKVKNVIVALGAQQIADNCYDAPTLDNVFCTLFERYRGPAGGGPFGEIPGQIQGNTLLSAGVNFAKRVRRGIDVDLSYRTDIGDNARIDTNLIYVHNFETSNFEDPANPGFENRILGELGDPKDEFQWSTDLTLNDITFGYQMRYIGKMWVGAYEDFNSVQGRPPENLDFADIRQYPETFYHNIRFEINLDGLGGIGKNFRFYGGIDNLLDTYPPLGLSGTGGGGAGNDRANGTAAIYDIMGRRFYTGFRARF